MGWWQQIDINDITIGCLPCVHFSGRGLFDRNKTLWASFSIKDKNKKVWFSGDTAYGEIFKEIGKKEEYFDLALIGIGAYEPRDFMCSVHATPEEAIQIAKDIKATKTIGMHWELSDLHQNLSLNLLKDSNKLQKIKNMVKKML